jgi:uncharacterized protein (TIGR01244 family)
MKLTQIHHQMIGIVFIIVFAIPIAAQQEVPPIRNFLRVNEQFCTGGQPRLEHLQQLKDEGVKAIINLRPPGEHRAAEEEAKAKELGLRYFNIPVVFSEPRDEQATEFLKVTDDPANRPAFIHCASAIRVGAFWLIRRVLRDGWSIEKAEEEAKKVGLTENPHLNEFARSYIKRYQESHPAKGSGSLTSSVAAEFSMMEVSLEPGARKKNVVSDRSRTYDAFTVSDTRIFVAERRTRKVFELRGLPLAWRPFSDLAWRDNQTLRFSRWSQPHYGVRYLVNVKKKKLVSVEPFPG